MKLPADPRMIDYLLGRLTPADLESVREEIFASEDGWERLAAAEEELVDSYARGDLSPEWRVLVEQRMLSSEEGLRKLRTARALVQLGRRPRLTLIPAVAWLAAALVLAAAGLALWWSTRPRAVPAAPPVFARLTIPLKTERAAASMPRVKLPSGGLRLRIELQLAAPEPPSNGTARFLFRDAGRAYSVSINGSSIILELDPRDLHEGPCQIEVTAGARLIAAGSVLFAR